MRSPGAIRSANPRRRSLRPMTSKPCSWVAAKFSGEPVRTQFWAGASGTGAIVGGPLGDRDVLDLDRGPPAQLESLQVPVDQRTHQQQQLADELDELVGELAGDQAADDVDEGHQRLQLPRGLFGAAAGHRVAVSRRSGATSLLGVALALALALAGRGGSGGHR